MCTHMGMDFVSITNENRAAEKGTGFGRVTGAFLFTTMPHTECVFGKNEMRKKMRIPGT